MPQLEPLRADHAAAVLAFERANRAYFAASISDRGDDFFARYPEQHAARLVEQDDGRGAYFVLVEPDGSVVGRVNLILGTDGRGTARLGYRMAQAATGRGLATAAVREVCALAGERYGVHRVVAATSRENLASQRVLVTAGFTLVGPADPVEVGGKQGYRYELMLRSDEPRSGGATSASS